MKIDRFINGANYQQAAKLVLMLPGAYPANKLVTGDVICTRHEYLHGLFSTLKTHTNKYILITHSTDYSVTKEVFDSRPTCISKWYARNMDYTHPDLIPIPIGFEDHIGSNKGAFFDVPYMEQLKPYAVTEGRPRTVYCNFNPGTSRDGHRQRVKSLLEQKPYAVFDTRKPFAKYCDAARQHAFVASPRGNGTDCHRTWEALYLGCIPIVDKHTIYDAFAGEGLPIIQVSDWNEVDHIVNTADTKRTVNVEALTIDYWLSRIRDMSKAMVARHKTPI